jgi:hypothetical protein
MRSSLAVIALLAGTASADPDVLGPSDVAPTVYVRAPHSHAGMWLDVGVGVANVAPGDGNVYRDSFVRFAPQTTLNRVLYIGGEINIGSFDNSTQAASPEAARGGGVAMPMSALDGTVAGAAAIIGARTQVGMLSAAFELAGGARYTNVRTNGSYINTETQGVVQARGRLDLWTSRMTSIGAMVGKDLTDTQSMMIGLNLALHFEDSH